MRLLYLLFFVFLPTTYIISNEPIIAVDSHLTPLVVVIMVKNEAEVIKATLEPFVVGGVDSFLVYDTGSTDGTPTIAQQFFDECGLGHVYIIEEPFVDFATSRNRALNLAETIFPYADFIIMPDAEWYIKNAAGLIEFCKSNKNYIPPNTFGGCYLIRTICGKIDYYQPRLIRCQGDVRFVGVVHEVLNQRPSANVPEDVYFLFQASEKGVEKSTRRWQRDLELLLQSYYDDPGNPRMVFYLAQTYQFLDDWENAALYYYKRTQMEGWHEEKYMATYRLAISIECLMAENNSSYTWEQALYYYLKAYGMRPHRVEPLVKIAQYYIATNQKEIAFLFAQRAAQLPYPDPQYDILMVEKYVYDYVRHDLLGQCALSVQEYELGKNAILRALKVEPEQTHLHHNLALYLQHITI